MKACRDCKQEKPLDEFPVNRRNTDGRDIRCKICCAAKTRAWRKLNPESARESEERWRKKNPDSFKRIASAAMLKYRSARPEEWRQRAKTWREDNVERNREAKKIYRLMNLAADAEKSARRRARKKNATPAWLTDSQRVKIGLIYRACEEISRKTGIPHQVDHIVPLTSEVVCGLHVPWNLAVITAIENQRKKNRILPDIIQE